jgi:membrane protein involved in D-alanine export
MVLAQYSSVFSLLIFSSLLIPAVILGLLGKKIKWYGIIVSILMISMIIGSGKAMRAFLVFLVIESSLIAVYFYFRNNFKTDRFYYLIFGISILPLIAVKVSAHFTHPLGFLGISYISFKVWQMLIEIHDGHIEKLEILETLYFLTYFPTLSSGPIDRYNRFTSDLESSISREGYMEYLIAGIKKIALGFFYKFAIASLINTYIISSISKQVTLEAAVMYMYAYTFYLFFDFAGYSNLAIGTSYLLGIRAPENFNKPFLAHDLKEFWQRWHISLSKWLGDYVFSRFVLNTMRGKVFQSKKMATRYGYLLTMSLMGIWHGFYLYYLVYGLYHGIMMVITDYYINTKGYRNFKKNQYYDIVSRIICFHIVAFGMLLFSGYLFNY